MRARHLGPRIALASLLVGAAAPALAEPPVDDAIAWSAPPGCPGSDEVRATLGRLLGRPPGRPGDALRVVGEVTRDPGEGRWRLRLSMSLRGGLSKERRLESETCAQITDAAAVVLALAIDSEPAPPPPALEAPEDEPPPEAPPVPRWGGWDLAAFGGVDLASLPHPTAGFGLGAGVDLGKNRLALYAMGWLPRRGDSGDPGVGGELSLVAGGLRYCRWLVQSTFGLAPCGGVEGGAILAAAIGAHRPTGQAGPWLAPQIGLLGAFRPTPRFALSLAVDALALVFRDDFVILGAGRVFRPPPATARALLGAHLRFP